MGSSQRHSTIRYMLIDSASSDTVAKIQNIDTNASNYQDVVLNVPINGRLPHECRRDGSQSSGKKIQ